MSTPSKQLSPNAPEFVPRGYATNNVIHGNGVHQNAHLQQHHSQHHIRDLPQQMNALRLNNGGTGYVNNSHQVSSSSSVQDRLHNFRHTTGSLSSTSNGSIQQGHHYQQQQQNFHQQQHHPSQQARGGFNEYNNGGSGAILQQQQQYHHHAVQPHHQQHFNNHYRNGNGGVERHNYSNENRRFGAGTAAGGGGGSSAGNNGSVNGVMVNGAHQYHSQQQMQNQQQNHHHNHGPQQNNRQSQQHHVQQQQNHHHPPQQQQSQQQQNYQSSHHGHQYGNHQNQNAIANEVSVTGLQNNHSTSPSSVGVAGSAPSSQDPQQQTEEETFAVNYIESLINCLNENPGYFDSITTSTLSVFEGFGNNEYILSNAMEMIFNRSIDEQNFRYMGAKLYGLLDLIDLKESSLFRMLLTLKLEYHRNEILNYMQNEQSKVRGTTLFLAELYMQLRNDGNRIKEIAQNIVFSINQLLLKATPENLKCICMTLKLAGYDLEFDCQNDMANIMQRLSNIEALDVSTSRILENVLNLQKNQWGRKAEPPISLSPSANMPLRVSDEPVFYGPDGEIITEEESSFLIANLGLDGSSASGGSNNINAGGNGGGGIIDRNRFNDSSNACIDSDSDLEVDPEMDEETKKAYKAFIKATKQQQLQQQQHQQSNNHYHQQNHYL